MMAVIGTFAYEIPSEPPDSCPRNIPRDGVRLCSAHDGLWYRLRRRRAFCGRKKSIEPKQFALFMFIFGASMFAVAFAPSLHVAIIGMAVVGFFLSSPLPTPTP